MFTYTTCWCTGGLTHNIGWVAQVPLPEALGNLIAGAMCAAVVFGLFLIAFLRTCISRSRMARENRELKAALAERDANDERR